MVGPQLHYPAELLLKAQGLRVAFLDVDGVLTDGGIYLTADGETIKRFHTLDGYGLQMLRRIGIEPVVITGRDSVPLRQRLQALGVVHAHYGVHDKLEAAQECLAQLGLDWAQAAVIGDDWPDLPLITRCAFSAAPPGSHVEVLARVDYRCSRAGGDGAAREFCDVLVVASGRYASLLDEVLAP
jgi:3-deoxy-D-manno-octulosonate 8-phosphate phosphatase (KDO 8-P phosphatase)